MFTLPRHCSIIQILHESSLVFDVEILFAALKPSIFMSTQYIQVASHVFLKLKRYINSIVYVNIMISHQILAQVCELC